MSFFSSLGLALAFKAAYQFAESKKWLPKRVYNKKSLSYLQNGELEKAAELNRFVLQKDEQNEQGLVVRDLIAMHKDLEINKISNSINDLQNEIQELYNRTRTLDKRILKYNRHKVFLNILLVVSAVVIIASLLLFSILNPWLFFSLFVAEIFIFIYVRKKSEHVRMKIEIISQDLMFSRDLLNKQITEKEKQLAKYKDYYNEALSNR